MDYKKRFPKSVGHVGTHWEACYKSHPGCAYLVGQADERARIAEKVRELRWGPMAVTTGVSFADALNEVLALLEPKEG